MRCTICKLPEQKRAAVDAALAADGVSLMEVSVSSGLSKSALQRHSKHLTGLEKPEAPSPLPAVIQEPIAEVSAPTKETLLDRIEFLWSESLDGLAISKEPITLTKPDGTSVSVPGDLRSRVGFLREARSVLELQGAATGELIKGQPTNQIGMIQIVMPAGPAYGQRIEIEAIEIAMPKR